MAKKKATCKNGHVLSITRKHYGKHSYCNACAPHKDYKAHERKLKHRYGITVADYESMLVKQGGECVLCGTPPLQLKNWLQPRLDVDHSHLSGKVRGLLCHSCNLGLGFFKDNTAMLRKAINYLETNS